MKTIIVVILLKILSPIHISASEFMDDQEFDSNKDGLADIFITHDRLGFYELSDRNYDGKVDQALRYNSESQLDSGNSDSDFDEYFETVFQVLDGYIVKDLVDTNSDGRVDLCLYYKNTQLERSVGLVGTGQFLIEVYSYEYGRPIESNRTSTQLTSEEFDQIMRQKNSKCELVKKQVSVNN
jgi:hypothetical protein